MKIAEEVKEFFHNEGIHSTTIQPEFTEVFFSIKSLSRSNWWNYSLITLKYPFQTYEFD